MSDKIDERLLQLLLIGAALHADDDEIIGDSKSAYKLGEYLLVAAIDFGTTYSGYAFSFKSKKDDIMMNKNWGAETGFMSFKTPTCVLLDKDKKFKYFGYEAQLAYADMIENDETDFYYFERFKMMLHNSENLGRDTQLTASNGKSCPAVDIFSMALSYLKDHLKEAISKAVTSGIEENMIRWVITVPAIWSDASKQFMREAAFKGGLIDVIDSNCLLIALEPEAASLFVRSLDINILRTGEDRTIKVGTKYLVIDAGGGTLDVTAHQVQKNNKVKEIHYATGGALGGIRVDEEFEKLLMEIFEKDFIDAFRHDCPSQWIQMMLEFEKKKRMPMQHITVNVQIPWLFGNKYQQMKGRGFHVAIKECRIEGIKFGNGVLCIEYEAVKRLFEPVVNDIVAHINGLMQKPHLHDVEYFFCVGGFNESKILQEALDENFVRRVKIILPNESSLAIVKGAVQFGHAPDIISSRISSKTYGVDTMTDFLPFLHPISKAVKVNDNIKCLDVFIQYVKKGQDVPVGYSKTIEFTPGVPEQNRAEVNIYSSENRNVHFVTDDGVHHHGVILVDWAGHGLDRKLKITMTFGGTEVQVSAVSYPGENVSETKINFMNDEKHE